MVTRVDSQNSKLDILWWTAALIILGLSIGQYYLIQQSQLIKFVLMLLGIGATVFFMARTALGQRGWLFWLASVQEARKVVWPNRQETTQMTLLVLAMVFVMGLLLWGMDAVLHRLIALVTGYSGG